MKFKYALNIAKLTHKALNMLNSNGSSMPGKILSKIYPAFLKDIQKYITDKLYVITGTNGKTTTSGILAQILKDAGRVVLYNDSGANMPNGIITTLALGFEENLGKKEVNNLVIESDEAYLKNIFEQLNFDYLILTNLFPDQTDRYSDPKFTAKKIQEAVDLNPELKLIVNADDPNLDFIGEGREKIYYGLEKVEFFDSDIDTSAPEVHCPTCSCALKYEKKYYSQLGIWSCECGKNRPRLDIKASAKVFKDYSYLDISYDGKNYQFKIKLTGLYNVYNVLAAVSAALVDGVERTAIAKALDNFKTAFGREVQIEHQGKKVTIYLIKNPAGANETLRKLDKLENAKLMIAMNDEYADGRDISWIWDTKFEALADFDKRIFLSGSRADDAALRLKHAHFDTSLMIINNNIESSLKEALDSLENGERLVILSTYTPLLALQKILDA